MHVGGSQSSQFENWEALMSEIKVSGLPGVEEKVWRQYKTLLHKCREQQAAGFGQGTMPYEVALDSLKEHAYDNNLLLGHVTAIAEEYAYAHPY